MSQCPRSPLNSSDPQPFNGIPVTQCIISSFGTVSDHVYKWCRHYLAGFDHADVSPEDARQNVLLKILTLGFARNFDPRKGTIMQFIHGVTRNECSRMIALHRRNLKHQRELAADTASPARAPDIAAQHAEFVQALHEAKNVLMPGESKALAELINGEIQSFTGTKTERLARHVRAFRGRRRLARSLNRFRPG